MNNSKTTNSGDKALEFHKFCEGFNTFDCTFISATENQYEFGIQVNGSWAVRSPTGKVVKARTSLSGQIDKDKVFDMIYLKRHSSFFIYEKNRTEIWKMGISDLHPIIWMTDLKISTTYLRGNIIREVLRGKAIVLLSPKSSITLIGIKEDSSPGKVVEVDLSANRITQMEVGGEHGDILIALVDKKKELLSCQINDDLSVKYTVKFSLSSLMNEGDKVKSMAISPCAKYVLAHVFNSSYCAAKQLMISVNGVEMTLCGTLDLAGESIKYFGSALAYLKTIGDDLIFEGIGWSDDNLSKCVTMAYNQRTQEFKELESIRRVFKDSFFNKLTRQGDSLYVVGFRTCKLLKIKSA